MNNQVNSQGSPQEEGLPFIHSIEKEKDFLSQEPIAHSKDNDLGVEEQRYSLHILNTIDRSLKSFDESIKYTSFSLKIKSKMRCALHLASNYHDLTKLDNISQEILKGNLSGKMINHVDGGTSHMIDLYKSNGNSVFLIAAILIEAHHIGLLNIPLNKNDQNAEDTIYMDMVCLVDPDFKNNVDLLRDKRRVLDKYFLYKNVLLNEKETIKEYIDRILPSLLYKHEQYVHTNIEIIEDDEEADGMEFFNDPFIVRFLLSCLSEGDRWDTNRNYRGSSPDVITLPAKSKERLKHHLSKYKKIKKSKNKREQYKNKIRQQIHTDCENILLDSNFFVIPALPSYGKTFSANCLSLRLTDRFSLRGSLWAAPYNNILSQNVKEIENFSSLPGEKRSEVVGEHYRDAGYYVKSQKEEVSYSLAKRYNILWQCPIEFVSLVQLLETMSSNHPTKLQKFHQLVGRVIILDEYHVGIPVKFIRQTIMWLKNLTEKWGCKVILLSGSPSKFWDIEELKSCDISVRSVLSEKSEKAMNNLERKRIRHSRIIEKFSSFADLAELVFSKSGPIVVMMNTVFTAAAFAKYAACHYGAHRVEHLSTALTPKDAKRKYKRIKKRLKNKKDKNWILVATSCVGTGVNLSFKTGFIESCSFNGALQIGGRVNRHNEYAKICDVFVFELDHEKIGTSNNPAFFSSIRVLNEMFSENKVNYNYCTEALSRELKERNMWGNIIEELERYEFRKNFAKVADIYRLIPHIYKGVLIDKKLQKKQDQGEIIPYHILCENSVQIYPTKFEKPIFNNKILTKEISEDLKNAYIEKKIKCPKEINVWTGNYDKNFLGYMVDILTESGF